MGTGAAPGPNTVVYDNSVTVHPAGDSQIAASVQEHNQSWGAAQSRANIPQNLPHPAG
ncbi:MAG: hypothetical protein NVS4B6_19410 [Mycobacterium sp.]